MLFVVFAYGLNDKRSELVPVTFHPPIQAATQLDRKCETVCEIRPSIVSCFVKLSRIRCLHISARERRHFSCNTKLLDCNARTVASLMDDARIWLMYKSGFAMRYWKFATRFLYFETYLSELTLQRAQMLVQQPGLLWRITSSPLTAL